MRKLTRSGNRQLNAHDDHKRQIVIIWTDNKHTINEQFATKNSLCWVFASYALLFSIYPSICHCSLVDSDSDSKFHSLIQSIILFLLVKQIGLSLKTREKNTFFSPEIGHSKKQNESIFVFVFCYFHFFAAWNADQWFN